MREVTPEERERARDRSRRMYQSDMESDRLTLEYKRLKEAGLLPEVEKRPHVVTPEERERARDRSRRMYLSDKESDEATVFERGRREGEARAVAVIVQKLKNANMSISEIARVTGLSVEEVETAIKPVEP